MEEIKVGTNKTKDFFDKYADTWDDLCKHDPEKIAAIVTLAGIKQQSRVADIACGTGILFSEILSHNPAFLLGVDLSDKMIEKASSKFSDPRLHLNASDFFDVHETNFDTIFIYNAYPHFLDKAKLAAHLSDMLRKNGRIMIAHSESRNTINKCHEGNKVNEISYKLQPVQEEIAKFTEKFYIDMAADTDDIYFFSGIKK